MNEIDKQHKKELLALNKFTSAITVQFAFGRLKTFYDLLKAVGHNDSAIKQTWFPSEYEAPLTKQKLNEYLSDRHIELTTRQWLEKNPPIQLNHDNTTDLQQSNQNTNSLASSQTNSRNTASSSTMQTRENDAQRIKEEPFEKSPNEKAFFFWFQKKAITDMFNKIVGKI